MLVYNQFVLFAVVGWVSITTVAARQAVRTKTKLCHGGSPSVKTNNGTVCGLYVSQFAQDVFLGVPFAQPPVEDLRLRHPKSYNTTYSNYDATTQPPSCPGYAGFDAGIGPLSEDCLYLNVVVPENTIEQQQRLPVLVW